MYVTLCTERAEADRPARPPQEVKSGPLGLPQAIRPANKFRCEKVLPDGDTCELVLDRSRKIYAVGFGFCVASCVLSWSRIPTGVRKRQNTLGMNENGK